MGDRLAPIETVSPIVKRLLSDPVHAMRAIRFLLRTQSQVIYDWVHDWSDEYASRFLDECFGDLDHGDSRETMSRVLDQVLRDFDSDTTTHPAVVLMGQEILWEAVMALCVVGEGGSVVWRGRYGSVAPLGDLIFVAGEGSDSDAVDAITLLSESGLFDKPFD